MNRSKVTTRGRFLHGKRRWVAIAVAGLATLAAILGLGSALLGGAEGSDADQVASVMRSVTSDVSGAVPEQYGEQFDANLADAFPEGTTVDPLIETWAPDGVAGGSMDVEISTGAQVTKMHAIFGHVDDTWLLITMEEIK